MTTQLSWTTTEPEKCRSVQFTTIGESVVSFEVFDENEEKLQTTDKKIISYNVVRL